MSKELAVARIFYIGIWLAAALYTLLAEFNVVPTAYVHADASLEYALHMLCVVLTLSCTWGALRLFAFAKVKNMRAHQPHMLGPLNLLRTGMLAMALFINLLVYYALLSGTTPLFCLLITLTGFVFCWPKSEE